MAAANTSGADNNASSSSTGNSGGGGKGNTLTIVISVVNLLATFGMLVILFISFQREKNKPSLDELAHQASTSSLGGHGAATSSENHGESEAGSHDSEAAHSGGTSLDFGKMVTLEQFTVNLSTPGSVNPKFVRVNISLEVPTDDAETEVNSKMPQVRNVIIDLFNSKRPADLATGDGREYLKEEIRNSLNSFLINGKVKGVFFTSFALAG